jgi:hypothetical protein
LGEVIMAAIELLGGKKRFKRETERALMPLFEGHREGMKGLSARVFNTESK